jgi:hypothetical protein
MPDETGWNFQDIEALPLCHRDMLQTRGQQLLPKDPATQGMRQYGTDQKEARFDRFESRRAHTSLA